MTNAQLKIIKRALFDAEMIEIKKLEAFPEAKGEHSEEYIKKISELRQRTKIKKSSIINLTPKRKIAILVAALITLALTITACAFAEQIEDFTFKVYEKFTSVYVEGEPDTSEFVQCMPSYIPDDYVLADNEVISISSRAIWYNGSHRIFLDQDRKSSNIISLDTEDSPCVMTTIGSNQVYYVSKNNTYVFLWIEKNYQFSLTCHSSLAWDEIEKMICSISDSNSE